MPPLPYLVETLTHTNFLLSPRLPSNASGALLKPFNASGLFRAQSTLLAQDVIIVAILGLLVVV